MLNLCIKWMHFHNFNMYTFCIRIFFPPVRLCFSVFSVKCLYALRLAECFIPSLVPPDSQSHSSLSSLSIPKFSSWKEKRDEKAGGEQVELCCFSDDFPGQKSMQLLVRPFWPGPLNALSLMRKRKGKIQRWITSQTSIHRYFKLK